MNYLVLEIRELMKQDPNHCYTIKINILLVYPKPMFCYVYTIVMYVCRVNLIK